MQLEDLNVFFCVLCVYDLVIWWFWETAKVMVVVMVVVVVVVVVVVEMMVIDVSLLLHCYH